MVRLNVDVYLHLSNSALFPIYEKNKQLGFGKGLFGRLWLFAGDLWSLAGGLWSFAGGLWSFLVVCGRLLVSCGHLRSLHVIVTTIFKTIFGKGNVYSIAFIPWRKEHLV